MNLHSNKNQYHYHKCDKVNEYWRGRKRLIIANCYEENLRNLEVEGSEAIHSNETNKLECKQIQYENTVIFASIHLISHG